MLSFLKGTKDFFKLVILGIDDSGEVNEKELQDYGDTE